MEFELYPILKAFHIISFVAWLSGLLYLPRLFAYHTTVAVGSEASETFKIMEARLLRLITTPAMIATFIFGFWMAFDAGWLQPGTGHWLHAKLAFVLGMAAFHGLCAKWRKDFAADRNTKSKKFYCMVNEIPAVILVIVVFLAILKPF